MNIEEKQSVKHNNRITSNQIYTLFPNQIFVFGSNKYGHHGGGAARSAMQRFGAVWGQGEGLQGSSYALPTMGSDKETAQAVDTFTACAKEHPELTFLVTRVGCGIAGHTANQMAPLFKACIPLENVFLPADFWQVLENE